MTTLLIMPAWNEEEVIGQTIATVQAEAKDYALLEVENPRSRVSGTAMVARNASDPANTLGRSFCRAEAFFCVDRAVVFARVMLLAPDFTAFARSLVKMVNSWLRPSCGS